MLAINKKYLYVFLEAHALVWKNGEGYGIRLKGVIHVENFMKKITLDFESKFLIIQFCLS